MLSVWAVNPEHISIAHAEPRLNMKARDKSTSYESHSQLGRGHRLDSSAAAFDKIIYGKTSAVFGVHDTGAVLI
jgi:hypothetical protein